MFPFAGTSRCGHSSYFTASRHGSTLHYRSTRTIIGRDWVALIRNRIDGHDKYPEQAIANDYASSVVILSGTHGDDVGSTALTNSDMFASELYEEDEMHVKSLEEDFPNINFYLINVSEYYKKQDDLRIAVWERDPQHIVMAFCNANHPDGDVKALFKDTSRSLSASTQTTETSDSSHMSDSPFWDGPVGPDMDRFMESIQAWGFITKAAQLEQWLHDIRESEEKRDMILQYLHYIYSIYIIYYTLDGLRKESKDVEREVIDKVRYLQEGINTLLYEFGSATIQEETTQ